MTPRYTLPEAASIATFRAFHSDLLLIVICIALPVAVCAVGWRWSRASKD
jgi:hypothetical protein